MRTAAFSAWVAAALAAWSGSQARSSEASERPARPPVTAEERARIEAAAPARPAVAPRRPRRLLIVDRNVGYPGHASIAHANLAFTLMGRRTGAWSTVVARDLAVFRADRLGEFDAVFFNNTVGNLFRDPGLRRNLAEFVYRGGGLMGVHGTTVAFTEWPGAKEDWPEFGLMLGARGASHRDSDEHVVFKFDDPDHPLNRPFRGGFEFRDEFFRVHEPYSRDRVRVLFSIDTEKTDMNQGRARGRCLREDNDYALAWVRRYGRGRVFYCTIGHNPYVFWNPTMLEFYLGAAQFALGDLPAPTLPSSQAAVLKAGGRRRPPERLEYAAPDQTDETLFESIERAAQQGCFYLCGGRRQRVSRRIARPFDESLDADARRAVRLKLDACHVRLTTYAVDRLPSEDSAAEAIFAFARTMGVERIRLGAAAERPERVQRLSNRYEIQVLGDDA